MDFYLDRFFGYNGFSGGAAGMAAAFLAIYAVMLVFVFLFGIVQYVFMSLGLFTLGKNRGLRNYGLAWVPVANMWIIGGIADDYGVKTENRDRKFRYWLLWLDIGAAGLTLIGTITIMVSGLFEYIDGGSGVPFVGAMIFGAFALIFGSGVLIACAVMEYIALYRIYKSCKPENAVLFIVLSIVFSVTIPFFIFAIRNKNEGMPGPDMGNPEPYTPEPAPEPPIMPEPAVTAEISGSRQEWTEPENPEQPEELDEPSDDGAGE